MVEFKKAERSQSKLRLALASPAGGGKTYSALLIARGLGGRIAMIDTERGSGSLYADAPDMPEYDVLELSPPYTPKKYREAINLAEKGGYDIIIIDSLSHAWAGEGGILEMHEAARLASKSGNSWTAWRVISPEHNQLVDAMLQSKCHVIATMRSKQEYAQVIEDNKTTIKKLGLAPVQREGMDYEFTVVFDLSQEHIATATKDRTNLFDNAHFKPSVETGERLLAWLKSAKAVVVKPGDAPAEQEKVSNTATGAFQERVQQPSPQPPQDAPEAKTSHDSKQTGGIDIDALLQQMIDKGLKTAGEQRTWIGKTFPGTVVSGPLAIIIGRFSPEQREALCKKLAELAELK